MYSNEYWGQKSRQVIRRAVRQNPDAVICVTGCYAQTSPAEIMAIPVWIL